MKWHLTYTRKKERALEAAGAGAGAAAPPPLKWFGRLGEAFDAAVAELGGLYTARPMAIVARLETEFPEVTMQVGGKGGGVEGEGRGAGGRGTAVSNASVREYGLRFAGGVAVL